MAIENKKKILITGLSGAVGQAIMPSLKKKYDISSLSRKGLKIDGIKNNIGNINSINSINKSFKNIHTVIHLAANGGVHSQNGMEASWEEILESNIVGTYNVFQSSIKNGVKRIIFASSGSTIMGYEDQSPYSDLINGKISNNESIPLITKKSEPNPKSFYSVSKLFGEDLARMYTSLFNISIICIRIGGCSKDGKPSKGRGNSIFVSHNDLSQLVIKSIEAPKNLKFDLFFGVSNNKNNYRDWKHAYNQIGYKPEDSAEKFTS
tara:strand:- start:196 stop:987 length:792 start_codon:yes stop_codon:yes gene_type:complete